MRNLTTLQIFCAIGLLTHASTAEAKTNRNVVLLISDNQNWNDVGCYGNDVVQTPNIDRLAAQGIRFNYAFATTASCGPSRAVIFTGLHVHQNGQYGHGHGVHTFRLMPKVETVFSMLQKNGYRTALLGKQHTTPAESYPFDFDPSVNSRNVVALAKAARQFMKESEGQPFFLTIGFGDPHPTSRARPGWGIKRDFPGVTRIDYDKADINVPSYLPDRPEVREGLAGYYQQISRCDQGVGLVLDAIRDAGHEDDTLVLFTSDHGSSEPGAMANHYEPGTRVPFIVRTPGIQSADTNAMVTLVDIVPTILDWTKTARSKGNLTGQSLLPVLTNPSAKGRSHVFLSHVNHEATMYYPMRTIRTQRYKLIWNIDWRSEFPQPIDTLERATWQEMLKRGDNIIGKRSLKKFLYRDELELYDLQTDSDEVFNLANSSELAEVRDRLSQDLFSFLHETKDPWMQRHDIPGLDNVERSPAFLHRRVLSEREYKSLFNGHNLDGWVAKRSQRRGYVVENGMLVCPADGGGFLFTEEEFDDFRFRFEFRLSKGANNGVAVRCPMVDKRPAYEGMELQIIDDKGYHRKLKPTQYHGSLYDVLPAKRGALKQVGEWNEQEISCLGRRITVVVNGIVILDADLDSIRDPEVVGRHPGLARNGGHIGLLGHGSRVEFRNLRVLRLELDD